MKLNQLTMISSCSSTIKSASRSSNFLSSLHSPALSSSSFALQPKSWDFISHKPPSFHGNSVSLQKRNLCVVSASKSDGYESFFRDALASMESVYLNRNPTAKAVLELVQSASNNQICYDHIAFRTFGEIIRKYTETSGSGNKHSALASALGSLTWQKPLHSEFQQLARFNEFIENNGFRLNSDGGILKGGVAESVPCSYIEFAERLLLPQYQILPDSEVKVFHRRDGFEVGNADKIFESTSRKQLTRRAA